MKCYFQFAIGILCRQKQFSACYWIGGYSINQGSQLLVYYLWKAFRSMCARVFPNSCFSYCLQSFSPSVFQHLFPEGVWPLLTYIHSAFSVSGQFQLFWVGLTVLFACGCLFGCVVLVVQVFVQFKVPCVCGLCYAGCIVFFASVCMMRSICLRRISSSVSIRLLSSCSSSSGMVVTYLLIFIGSLPFMVYIQAVASCVWTILLGPGVSLVSCAMCLCLLSSGCYSSL